MVNGFIYPWGFERIVSSSAIIANIAAEGEKVAVTKLPGVSVPMRAE